MRIADWELRILTYYTLNIMENLYLIENWEWRIENWEWRIENGESLFNGELRMENGELWAWRRVERHQFEIIEKRIFRESFPKYFLFFWFLIIYKNHKLKKFSKMKICWKIFAKKFCYLYNLLLLCTANKNRPISLGFFNAKNIDF